MVNWLKDIRVTQEKWVIRLAIPMENYVIAVIQVAGRFILLKPAS
nr:hypothetical protein [Priestia megaterium]